MFGKKVPKNRKSTLASMEEITLRIPVIEQHDSSDCGVACVASICAHYGKDISISKVRELLGTDAFGTSINGITQELDKLGFVSRAVYVDRESFSKGDFTLPCIARLVRSDEKKMPFSTTMYEKYVRQ